MVVTTLLQRSPPLLRYALEDRVRPLAGECPCGLPYPRLDVLGRAGDSFSVLGAKLSYGAVLSAVYAHADEPGHMQLELSRDDTEGLTIVLPEPLRHAEAEMRRDLIRSHPDIDFLVGSGMLTLGFPTPNRITSTPPERPGESSTAAATPTVRAEMPDRFRLVGRNDGGLAGAAGRLAERTGAALARLLPSRKSATLEEAMHTAAAAREIDLSALSAGELRHRFVRCGLIHRATAANTNWRSVPPWCARRWPAG